MSWTPLTLHPRDSHELAPSESQQHLRDTEGATEKEARAAKVAAARLASVLSAATLKVEKGSVYGATILMPQVARSGGWNAMLTGLSIRAYMFLFLNITLQAMLNLMISKEERVLDLFAGQMYLCNFGLMGQDNCFHGGEECLGPGGTEVSPERLYEWGQWTTRVFFRDSLLHLFPEKAAAIQENIDPGEYGLESPWCRRLCCFIFVLSVIEELVKCGDMARLLVALPTTAAPWLSIVEEEKYEGPMDQDPRRRDVDWLDTVRITPAGMPLHWKVISAVFILVPKCILWFITTRSGITMLMETSSIQDLIVNSVALTFVLNIDEVICSALMSDAAHVLLERCEGLALYDVDEKLQELESDELALLLHGTAWRLKMLWIQMPVKLITVFALTLLFMLDYHLSHCRISKAGMWVSEDVQRPITLQYDVWNLIFPWAFPIQKEAQPFWQMPGSEDDG